MIKADRINLQKLVTRHYFCENNCTHIEISHEKNKESGVIRSKRS